MGDNRLSPATKCCGINYFWIDQRKQASIEETKVLLQQIERWVTQSNGKLIEVQESKRRIKWYPACLIDVALGEDRKTA